MSTLNSRETAALQEVDTVLVNIAADLQQYLDKAAASDGMLLIDRDHIEEHIRQAKTSASKVRTVTAMKGYYPA